MKSADVVRLGAERLRVGPWRGHDRVAYVSPLPDAPAPSADAVRRCLEVLVGNGYRAAITAALSPLEQIPFASAGFAVRERLHLLVHDLLPVPKPVHAPLRRARRGDRAAVLAVDARAFPPFWRLDELGLRDALAATPATRFRVAADPGVVAYAICGRAGRRGYLQRLAVDPDHQAGGLGRALAVDGLRWMRRRGVDRAVVNTQEQNERALDLYERLGFRRQPGGLAVLEIALDDSGTPPGPPK